MKKQPIFLATLLLVFVTVILFRPTPADADIVVNSLEDIAAPTDSIVTLRSALAAAADGEPITFDASLDGGTIELTIVGNEHTPLVGEVMGMRDEPSGPVSYLVGYFDRDYGKSALYSDRNVVIDASALPSGITIAWSGGSGYPARVLAVRGNLTMTNVSITGGQSVAESLMAPEETQEDCNLAVAGDMMFQCSTRARGAGLAVWGVATLRNCKLYNNHCSRASTVPSRSRDAGAFGGGIYADIVDIKHSVISGNSVVASGVSGGGVFSVGGAEAAATDVDRRADGRNRQFHHRFYCLRRWRLFRWRRHRQSQLFNAKELYHREEPGQFFCSRTFWVLARWRCLHVERLFDRAKLHRGRKPSSWGASNRRPGQAQPGGRYRGNDRKRPCRRNNDDRPLGDRRKYGPPVHGRCI